MIADERAKGEPAGNRVAGHFEPSVLGLFPRIPFVGLGLHGVRKVFGCSNLLDFGTFGRHRGGIGKDRCAARGLEAMIA